jgi:lipopolysaccharide export system permease protein
LVLLTLPELLILVVPIACFIGVQYTFGRLIADSELVVMRACGLSQSELARPALLLGIIATLLMYSLTLFFLPETKNAFKDLQFQIRNQISSDIVQEGVFNVVSDTMTFYIRARDGQGGLRGLIIQDTRDRTHPATLTAESGVIAQVDGSPHILMFNGTRQLWDPVRGRLSVLSFDRWSLDLGQYRDIPGGRLLQPDERFLSDLFFPSDTDASPAFRLRLLVEGHSRLITPIYCVSYIAIMLAAQLTAELRRRGQSRRVLAAWALVAAMEAGNIGFTNLADHRPGAILLMYLNALLPLAVALFLLFRTSRASRSAEA